MNFNGSIHEQLAAAHRHDLLEAADRARLATAARQPRAGQPMLWAFHWRGLRRGAALEPCVRATTPRTATR
jgi:hypothetical protein